MATRTKEGLKRLGLASEPIYYPETASQTFKKGQLVCVDQAGRVKVAADSAVLVLGIAMADASGVTDALIPVDVIKPGDLLEMSAYHATPASAVVTDANCGDPFELVTVSNVPYVNVGANSNNLFYIIRRQVRDSATDTYPRVIVAIPATLLQVNGAAQTA